MFAIAAGQTAGLNWLNFFREPMDIKGMTKAKINWKFLNSMGNAIKST